MCRHWHRSKECPFAGTQGPARNEAAAASIHRTFKGMMVSDPDTPPRRLAAARAGVVRINAGKAVSPTRRFRDVRGYAARLRYLGMRPLPLLQQNMRLSDRQWKVAVRAFARNVPAEFLEIGNEPSPQAWPRYFHLVRLAAPIIHAHGKKIVLGAPMNVYTIRYLRAARAAGDIFPRVDGVAIHPYAPTPYQIQRLVGQARGDRPLEAAFLDHRGRLGDWAKPGWRIRRVGRDRRHAGALRHQPLQQAVHARRGVEPRLGWLLHLEGLRAWGKAGTQLVPPLWVAPHRRHPQAGLCEVRRPSARLSTRLTPGTAGSTLSRPGRTGANLLPSPQRRHRRMPLHLRVEVVQQRLDVSAVSRLNSRLWTSTFSCNTARAVSRSDLRAARARAPRNTVPFRQGWRCRA